MKTDRLKEIIAIVEDADIDVLHIEENDFKLYYQKNGSTPMDNVKSDHKEISKSEESLEKESNGAKDEPNEQTVDQLEEITSPMIGTFYSRSEDGADPYVQVGSTVAKGDTVCVLEAMKLMNEVPSTVHGEIVEQLVADGDVIEYGQPLFSIRVGE